MKQEHIGKIKIKKFDDVIEISTLVPIGHYKALKFIEALESIPIGIFLLQAIEFALSFKKLPKDLRIKEPSFENFLDDKNDEVQNECP